MSNTRTATGTSNTPSLLQFWKLQRKQAGEMCVVKQFHKDIARAFRQLVTGTLPGGKQNLMVLMPPRCVKTGLIVRAGIPWAQSYFPDAEWILGSYASDLATENSIHIRDTLSSEWYRSMVDNEWGCHVQMSGESAGGKQDHFRTSEGGSVKAVGTGGGITGFGAGKLRREFGGAIVIDDPIKPQDVSSAAVRKACVDWYHNTIESRKNADHTPVILIMQRLHPQDLAGHLLQTEREKWFVLQLPAYDEGTETSIWEERISAKSLREMKIGNPDKFWSQYQQSPTAGQGVIFKPEWWRYWTNAAEVEKRCTLKFITGDTAFKATSANDWSVFQLWGCDGISGLYLLDQIRGRWEFPELMKNAKDFWKKHNTPQMGITPCTEFWTEDEASGQSLVQMLRAEGIPARGWKPDEKKMNANRDPAHHIVVSKDKVGRANTCTMPISQGRIILPDPNMPGYRWVSAFVNEHESFTSDDSHLFDDQVDTQTEATLIWQARGGGRGAIPTAPWIITHEELQLREAA